MITAFLSTGEILGKNGENLKTFTKQCSTFSRNSSQRLLLSRLSTNISLLLKGNRPISSEGDGPR